MKRIAHFTTSRSDYVPSYWLLHDLARAEDFELLLAVAGSHLDPRHGATVGDIEADGLPIARRLDAYANDDDPASYARAASALTSAATQFLVEEKPDFVMVYGDRLELLPIATAAVIARTPIAHLCGGDVTAGALDEQVRHAVTKMAHLHFPSTELSARRIVRMGEEPWRVHCVGDPALDDFERGTFPSAEELGEFLGFVPDRGTILLTVHPETSAATGEALADAVIAAMREFTGPVIITGPGADPGSAAIRERMIALANERPHTIYREHLGRIRYRALLKIAGAIAGNSSSAFNEAAAVRLPAVNIGTRQEGRERNANVLDAPADARAILASLQRALDPKFREGLAGMKNVYGDGHSSRRIIEALRNAPPRESLLRKVFVDG